MSVIVLIMLATVALVGVGVYVAAGKLGLLKKSKLAKLDMNDSWAKDVFGSDAGEISRMLQGAASSEGSDPDSAAVCLRRCVSGSLVLRSVKAVGDSRVEITLADLGGGSDLKLSGRSVGRFSIQGIGYLHAALKDVRSHGLTTRIKSYVRVGDSYIIKWVIRDPSGFQITIKTKLSNLSGLILGSR